jgi:hypothetical protein
MDDWRGDDALSPSERGAGVAETLERADHRVDSEGCNEEAGLVVHATLGMCHTVRDHGREVPVEDPFVHVHVGVERDRDRVDRGRDGAVRLALSDALVRTERSGDRHVARELREETGV